jgi:hypothetical protein
MRNGFQLETHLVNVPKGVQARANPLESNHVEVHNSVEFRWDILMLKYTEWQLCCLSNSDSL